MFLSDKLWNVKKLTDLCWKSLSVRMRRYSHSSMSWGRGRRRASRWGETTCSSGAAAGHRSCSTKWREPDFPLADSEKQIWDPTLWRPNPKTFVRRSTVEEQNVSGVNDRNLKQKRELVRLNAWSNYLAKNSHQREST